MEVKRSEIGMENSMTLSPDRKRRQQTGSVYIAERAETHLTEIWKFGDEANCVWVR